MIQANRPSVVGGRGDNPSQVPEPPLISRFVDDPEMAEIIALFVAETPERRREFSSSWDRGDLHRVRTLAHQLKGAAGGYGYPELSAAASELEAALDSHVADQTSVASAYDALMALLSRVEAA
ncbi:MAG: Hpt domain-containing protein [Phycisphaeraceae bacterium]|nr:Hpt domain-containing protein [Phycisphaeraceae bacterium]